MDEERFKSVRYLESIDKEYEFSSSCCEDGSNDFDTLWVLWNQRL